ncbi:CD109 antigen-like [Mercenaria mercenaria]|uniref:CD109 antigen-like n=1 Tax=Mercenaria mercenaria TaxID=6596 RepID=UPI00234EB2F7|nr:CD109 antigen-like [Mercenaria mercenaria]
MDTGKMLFLLIISLSLLTTTASGYKSYIVLCPDTIRPGMEFNVQLNKLDSDLPKMLFMAEILNKKGSVVREEITVSAGTMNSNLVLNLPWDLQNSAYRLEVNAEDRDGMTLFKNSTDLNYMQKGMSVFIQTDKAIYKPGQKVQFRTFGANPDLTLVFGKMDISIYDINNNKISQWLGVDDPSGVFQGELQLSDQPPLGDWRIEVDFSGSSESMTFTVAEYVLPRFEVSVTVPSFGVMSDKYLTGKVEAKYTFGKGVEGNGTLVIKQKYSYRGTKELSLSFKINGVYKFIIDMKTLVDTLGSLNYATLELVAKVEEGLTGNTRTGSAEIQYFDREEKLVFMDGADNFKPGLKYTCYLFLSDQDDKPISTRDSQVNVTVTMHYGTKSPEPIPLPEPIPMPLDKRIAFPLPPTTTRPEQKHVLGPKTLNVPKNGIVPFTFSIPIYITQITIDAKFEKLQTSKWLNQFQSTSRTYIQISVKTRNPQTGKKCSFKVQSTVSRIRVNYLIISKGLLVKEGILKFKGKKKTKSLKIKLTADMAPSARCIVYWTKEDGEIIADSVQFEVKGIFKNKVDIDYLKPNGRKTGREQPGKNILIRVNADPGSQCNVLTVDKSVLLLKSGNDITPSKVEDELDTYDSQAPPPCKGFFPCWRSFYPLPVSGVDVTAIFQNSGVRVLTDAFLYKWQRPFNRYPVMYDGMMEAPMMRMKGAREEESGGGAGSGSGPRVRTLFPETWVYESVKANSNGTAIIRTTVPDTITSWVASAFAVNKRSGLGVAPTSANLEVFLKFFIRLELPYSVIRGEQVILQANIFNFFDTDLEVEVVLKKSFSFKNIIVQKARAGKATLVFKHTQITRKIKVTAGGGTTLNLPILPVELGSIDIEVRAVSSRAGDAVRRQLLVEPEGISESYNIPVLIDLQNSYSFKQERNITLPDDVVEGSVRIRISAIGDLMGPSISGLTNLLKMSYGCGEQNMVTFVPNIFVIKYLDAIKNLKTEDENKAKGFMLVGYQKELTYQHFDGSFSAFGNSDPSGSTWLTAFVVKSFSQARPYIFIDTGVMKKAIDWLLSKYNPGSGTFNEPGRVIHTEMQGGSATGESNLAIYTLIALMEAKDAQFSSSRPAEMTTTISGARNALETAVPSMEDIYELAIASYALALAKSSKLNAVLAKLDSKATQSGGMKYWEVQEEPDMSGLKWIPPHHQARSRNIETTAYVLLAYATSGKITSGLSVIRWLVNQRNPNGGFGSTQDTVIALQALAEFGALIHSDNFNVDVDINGTPNSFSHTFNIDAQNALLLQSVDAPSDTTNIDIKATGTGTALVEIAVSYNVMADFMEPLFALQLSFTDETMSGFKLKVCFRWLGEGKSGMAVLEVGLLSGFAGDKFSITQLGILKRVEDGDKKLVIYFEEIPGDEETCITMRMQREGLVAGSQPAVVKLYDYYDTDNHAFSMYQPKLLKDANVCGLLEKELGC